ncbi:MAG: hypothetical protein MUF55_14165 [Hydrogenophaga sp.]|nr:hypothetical protein [Hydrogenophaga sp.]
MSTPISPETVDALLPEVAQLIVEALNLDVAPADIDPSDDENNERIFASLRALTAHIASQRTQ